VNDEQARVLVETVERLTVIVQHINWQALPKHQTDRAGMLNYDLCNAFPWLKEDDGVAEQTA